MAAESNNLAIEETKIIGEAPSNNMFKKTETSTKSTVTKIPTSCCLWAAVPPSIHRRLAMVKTLCKLPYNSLTN